MLSVLVRQTLIQVETPDAVRGRVLAVHTIVAGTSNELGEFRAGTMAALIGAVPAVLFGGGGRHRRGGSVDAHVPITADARHVPLTNWTIRAGSR